MQQVVEFYPKSSLYRGASVQPFVVSTTDEVNAMLDAGAVVAIGVSGGKDSQATAIRLNEYLDEVGHSGPRVLIHSDLGRVEWKDSLPVCERLARRLGLDLIVVRRTAGDMMDRWDTRWKNNVARYANQECVKLILPWSTPGMRFCTSKLKTQIICAELTRRFPGQLILSVTGVRHDESSARARMAIASAQSKLSSRGCTGLNWNPIITWPTSDVFKYLDEQNEPLHEAYTVYNSTRVSCTYCIMGSIGDLNASASCEDNADIYREMVELEIRSTFAFQGARWLGDVAPHLLTQEQLDRLGKAKVAAAKRVEAESLIPPHLLYTKGRPTSVPTTNEAGLLAHVRRQVAEAVGIDVKFTTAPSILERYVELMSEAQGNS